MRVTSARRPSGVKATDEIKDAGGAPPSGTTGGGPRVTVATLVTVLPRIESTDSVPSTRFATSARSPCGLTPIPDGCLPTWTVPLTLGVPARSMTVTVVSGTGAHTPASADTHFRAFATNASPLCPMTATLVGGPVTLFSIDRLAVICGSSGWLMSRNFTVSDPGGPNSCLPVASQVTFSSLPTISMCDMPSTDEASGFDVPDFEHARHASTTPNPILKPLRLFHSIDMLAPPLWAAQEHEKLSVARSHPLLPALPCPALPCRAPA